MGAPLRLGHARFVQRRLRGRQERLGELAAVRSPAQQPRHRLDWVALDASPQMQRGAVHRLPVGVAARRGLAPPMGGDGRVAVHTQRVVMDHADARHRRGNTLLRRLLCPAQGLGRIGRQILALEQQPRQHVLGERVTRLGRFTIEIGGLRHIDRHKLAPEQQRGKIALADRIARRRREFQPFARELAVAFHAHAFGETSADIVLGTRDAGMRERPPDRESGLVILAIGGVARARHLRLDVECRAHGKASFAKLDRNTGSSSRQRQSRTSAPSSNRPITGTGNSRKAAASASSGRP